MKRIENLRYQLLPTRFFHRLSRGIWWIGGAIPDILEEYPTEHGKYYGIGGAIIFTCILAIISSYIALSVIVDSLFIQIPAALLWGLMIFNLDRFITISMKKNGNELDYLTSGERVAAFFRELLPAIPRFIIAFIIGLLISVPLELRIFDNEVTQEVHKVKTEALLDYNASVDKAKQESASNYSELTRQHDQELNKIQQDFQQEMAMLNQELTRNMSKRDQLQSKIDQPYTLYIKEVEGDSKTGSGIPGEGRIARQKEKFWQEKKAEYQDEIALLTQTIAELHQKAKTIEEKYYLQRAHILSMKDNLMQSLSDASNDYEQTKQGFQENLSDGLLVRIKALFQLGEDDAVIRWSLRLFILMIFLIESAPVLVKLMSSRGAYDARIEEMNYLKMFASDQRVEQLRREARKEMYSL